MKDFKIRYKLGFTEVEEFRKATDAGALWDTLKEEMPERFPVQIEEIVA